MEIEYVKRGGWISTHKLQIRSSGEANAQVVAHAGSEVLRDTTATLTADQRELLSASFASFARYDRHYQPKKEATDGNRHRIVLTYDGVPDTVSAYMPHLGEAPESLLKLINDLEQLHRSILELDN
jgi:hypothetical protein